MDRRDAERHWEYTAKIIDECIRLTRRAYIEAMLHGYKHGKSEFEVKGETNEL